MSGIEGADVVKFLKLTDDDFPLGRGQQRSPSELSGSAALSSVAGSCRFDGSMFATQPEKFLAHGINCFLGMSSTDRVAVPLSNEAAFRTAQHPDKLSAVGTDVVNRSVRHGGLYVHRAPEGDAAAEPLIEQVKPHVLLLIHLDNVQPDVNQVIQDGRDVTATVQEGEQSGDGFIPTPAKSDPYCGVSA